MTIGFNQENFKTLYEYEQNHFWFKARNQLIIHSMRKHLKQPNVYFEVGCGTGFVTRAVHDTFPYCQIIATELFDEAIKYAKSRVPNATFMQADARTLNLTNLADAVGVFDVLEHIVEDMSVLNSIYTLLKPNGTLFITVPQHQWLWSDQDDIAHHVRRYHAQDLHEKLQQSGFKILQSTSFVTSLLPMMLISRLTKNKKYNKNYKSNPTAELTLPLFLNHLFYFFMKFDLGLIKLGISLPIGGSRLVVAKKVANGGNS